MNEDTRKWLNVLFITIGLMIIVFLLLSGFEISNIEIHPRININFN